MNILIVGIGNMGFAIAKALKKSESSHTICVYDPWSKFLDDAQALGIMVHDSLDLGAHKECAYDAILVGVKPNMITSTLQSILPIVRFTKPTVLSIAAGVPIQTIAKALAEDATPYPHVVRYMPTIAALVNKSITAASPGPQANDIDKKRGMEVAKNFGEVIELPEILMDAFTGIAGSGIAFATAFVDALTLGGIKEGLPYDKAYTAARKATAGALALLESSFDSPASLITAISSPGGTTIAGIHALHENHFPAAVMNAVNAAAERSQELRT